jgi:hypothetical protein
MQLLLATGKWQFYGNIQLDALCVCLHGISKMEVVHEIFN